METCRVCNGEFKNLKGVITHVNINHELTSKEYYDSFFKKEGEGECVICQDKTSYRGFTVGYLKNCSIECRDKNKTIKHDYWKGKTQSKKHIEQRILNTDQKVKQTNWEKSIFEKYGVNNPSKLEIIKDKISLANKGKIVDRNTEWQTKIIDSKRKNGTLKHSTETKSKIVDSLNKYHKENLDREKYISTSNNVKHLNGWYDGLYFRSSLELSFLVNNSDKIFSSCEIKKYVVRYSANNKIKSYYPDYTDGEVIYEIKPSSLLKFGLNQDKIIAAKEKFGDKYKVITEQESNYISKETIKNLIENGNVVLGKNSEKAFEKYRY